MKRRVIVYGDIHGCLREFQKLREKIKPHKDDIEISVGDFLNKGKYSLKTLRYIEKNGILSVVGNNEEKILKYYKTYRDNPQKCKKKLRKFECSLIRELNPKDIHFLKSLPYFIKIKNLTVVHAGIKLGMKLKKKLSREEKDMLTLIRFYNKNLEPIPYSDKKNRFVFWSDLYTGHDGFIVFGHHPFKKPKISKFAIGVDTGCVYGGKLSAVVFSFDGKKVDTNRYKLYQQKAMKNYFV